MLTLTICRSAKLDIVVCCFAPQSVFTLHCMDSWFCVTVLQAQQLTGVTVPSYYNPAAVNPLKYAEQLKKRKMLWSKAPKETTADNKEKEVRCHRQRRLFRSLEFDQRFSVNKHKNRAHKPVKLLQLRIKNHQSRKTCGYKTDLQCSNR